MLVGLNIPDEILIPRSPDSLSDGLLMLEMALKNESFTYEVHRDHVLCDLLCCEEERL